MALVVATLIMSIVAVLIQCTPVNYTWLRLYGDPTIATGTCNEERTVLLTYEFSAIMALCDIALGVIPVFMVCSLQMAWRMKAAISCILGLAAAASAAVIARTVYLAQTHKDAEYFVGTVPFLIWSNVETSIGIVAGSLATLGPLLRHFRLFSNNSGDPARTPTPRPRVFVRPRGLWDLSYPLSSFRSSKLRADKLSTIMTQVQTRDGADLHEKNASWEHLTVKHSRGVSQGTDGCTKLEIYRTYDVTQISDAGSANA
ncbi:hypothetical protein BJY00DRAFT_318055 [Aspergillus carlsbadensis]|nr:hypothetical protein BJY00DRAFT_318055 [Aspergillus carlsbadensis]